MNDLGMRRVVMSLNGKMVVIIGFNLGIGLGVVCELVCVGVDVVLNFFIDCDEDYVFVVEIGKEFGVMVCYIKVDMFKGDECC